MIENLEPISSLLTEKSWKKFPDHEYNLENDVILTSKLVKFLKTRTFQHKGKTFRFTNQTIDNVIRNFSYPELEKGVSISNKAFRETLTQGMTTVEFIEGRSVYPTIDLIDWNTPSNNQYYFASPVKLKKSNSNDEITLDTVLFINGIPICIVKYGPRDIHTSYQKTTHIPKIYAYTQLLISIGDEDSYYGHANIQPSLWEKIREQKSEYCETTSTINTLFIPEKLLLMIRYGINLDASMTPFIANHDDIDVFTHLLNRHNRNSKKPFLPYSIKQPIKLKSLLFLCRLSLDTIKTDTNNIAIISEKTSTSAHIQNFLTLNYNTIKNSEKKRSKPIQSLPQSEIISLLLDVNNTEGTNQFLILTDSKSTFHELAPFTKNILLYSSVRLDHKEIHLVETHQVNEPKPLYTTAASPPENLLYTIVSNYFDNNMPDLIKNKEENFLIDIICKSQILIEKLRTENSLNSHNLETEISRTLLPILYDTIGLEHAQCLLSDILNQERELQKKGG